MQLFGYVLLFAAAFIFGISLSRFRMELRRPQMIRRPKRLLAWGLSGIFSISYVLLALAASAASAAAVMTQQMVIFLVIGAVAFLLGTQLRKSKDVRLKASGRRLTLLGLLLLGLVAYMYFMT